VAVIHGKPETVPGIAIINEGHMAALTRRERICNDGKRVNIFLNCFGEIV
jgi:hypothetical protein